VLVICNSIKDVKSIYVSLSKKYDKNLIVCYTRNDNEEDKIVEKQILKGEIILATNLAGRGTDFKLGPEIEQLGGMFVCIGFLPLNVRVEEQAFGRTAREGKRGTAQLIINF